MALSSRRGRYDDEAIATINVTPFVDVLLVLLIIFMITAGVVELGMRVSVPRTREVADPAERRAEFTIVEVTSDGRLVLNNELISVYDIVERVKRSGGAEKGVYVRAHRTAPWDTVAQVLAEVGSAGMKINLVSKPLRRDPRVRRRR